MKGGPPPGFEEAAPAELIPGDAGETGGQKQFSSLAPVYSVQKSLGELEGRA